ncbi:B-type flagellin [Thalassovita gelatinovora]|uniref:Flagellin n=1 Tax=Thalassovita gelatinovora TaxID=53501 RepID=A0A0P1FKI5_THAGE|nr:flagellin [Thalassovita gelatinovora]QIZ79005.1 flagellar filament protein [Thalassovita gelatinovora]CUH68556.1 B-type flagellin [Thalassovita gelatinovora]SEQ54550.1 flagellin [Thalassovita gelatinovora]
MTTINTNIGALSAQATMSRVNTEYQTSMERLSSGQRINSASDDAAGMAISEKMTAQIKGLSQAVRNATDGKNLLDTTEGAHVEVSNMLQRLRELSVQSANDTNTASDRNNLAAEGTQLITEINRVAKDTTFNGMKILDGSFTGKQLQIGADSGQTINIDVDSAAATDIGAHTVSSKVSLASGGTDTGIAASTTLDITGHSGSASITTSAGQSAKSLADEINSKSAATGVDATAVSKAKLSGFSAASTVTFEVNGTTIGNVNISDTSDLRGLRDAINTQAGQTGVTATMGNSNGEIILTDQEGNDIELTNYDTGVDDTTLTVTALNADGTAAGSTADTHTTTLTDTTTPITSSHISGQVSMTSTKGFSVGSDVTTAGTSFFEAAANSSSLESVAEIDLTTAQGASSAIKVIDVALDKVNQARSNLGAVSNRLDSTISNLTNISVNVEAARSGIQDADFAKESTSLARGKILSQASTAMLAQANSSKQSVMQLLQG